MSNNHKKYNQLFYDPLLFGKTMLKKTRRNFLIFKTSFISLNVVILFSGLAVILLTTWVLADIALHHGGYPLWFFFASSGISAFTTLLSSLLNFFIIKDKMKENKHQNFLIGKELEYFQNNWKHYSKKTVDLEYIFFTKVAQIMNLKKNGRINK